MAANLYTYDIVVATELIQTAVDHLLSAASTQSDVEKTVPPSLRRELEQWQLSERGVECGGGVEMDATVASGRKMMAFETVLLIQKQLKVTPLPGEKALH